MKQFNKISWFYISQIEEEHAEALKELSNVRELLMAQYKVNEASQGEITMLTEKIKDQEKEFQSKLQEYVQSLNVRNERIQVKYDFMVFKEKFSIF